jgi:small subunit ribosomal protein S1
MEDSFESVQDSRESTEGSPESVEEAVAPKGSTESVEAVESTEGSPEPVEAAVESTEGSPEPAEAVVESTEGSPEPAEAVVESTEGSPEPAEAAVESTEGSPEPAEVVVESTEGSPESMAETLAATSALPSMAQLLEEESYVPLRRGDIRRGEVIAITPSFVVMDIRAKREGFVPKRDLDRIDREMREQVEVGAEFPVYILNPEDAEGRAIVSISRGLVQTDWDRAKELLESQEIWEGQVSGYNRGGLLVSFGRLRGFVPTSHLVGFPRSLPPEEKRQRQSEMVDQSLGLRVIEVDQRRNRLVLSERAAYREWREQQQERLLEELKEGRIIQGRVSSIQDFGAFVDIGGMDGLVHISELSWKRVNHPSEVVKPGQELTVMVIRLDRQRKRISLSLRQTQEDPWERIEERYTLGQLITGRISRIVSYGAFVEVEEEIEGLVHISELADERVGSPSDIVEEGEVLPLRVIRIDAARRRLGLSARRVTPQEWEDWRASRIHMEEELLELTEGVAVEEAQEAATDEPAEETAPAPAEEEPAPVEEMETTPAEETTVEPRTAEESFDEEASPEEPTATEESSEPVAEESEPEPAEEAIEPVAEESEPEPAEEAIEPVAEESEPEPAEEAIEPVAEESEPEPAEEAIEPVAEESEPEPAEEAIEPAAEESEPEPVEGEKTIETFPQPEETGEEPTQVTPEAE